MKNNNRKDKKKMEKFEKKAQQKVEFEDYMAQNTKLLGVIISMIGCFYTIQGFNFILNFIPINVVMKQIIQILYFTIIFFNFNFIAYRLSNLYKNKKA